MNTDFIEVYDNVLSSEQCEKIINFVNNQKLVRGNFSGTRRISRPGVTMYSSGGVNTDVKDSWEFPGKLDESTFYNTLIENALRECVDKYVVSHPQIHFVGSWGPDVKYNIQKYNPKQGYYALHCENGGNSNRMLVWMIYLNTVTDGGGTYFQNYDRITDAVEGRVVLWPPYWTHCHNGVVSNTQTKYIATGWFES